MKKKQKKLREVKEQDSDDEDFSYHTLDWNHAPNENKSSASGPIPVPNNKQKPSRSGQMGNAVTSLPRDGGAIRKGASAQQHFRQQSAPVVQSNPFAVIPSFEETSFGDKPVQMVQKAPSVAVAPNSAFQSQYTNQSAPTAPSTPKPASHHQYTNALFAGPVPKSVPTAPAAPKPSNDAQATSAPAKLTKQKEEDRVAADIKQVMENWTQEWGRSKLMIIGEGRAGKTALANSLTGQPFQETESTTGINLMNCDIRLATTEADSGAWVKYQKPEKELESAIARSIAAQVTQRLSEPNRHSITAPAASRKDVTEETEPLKVDTKLVMKCLASNVQMKGSNLILSIFDFGGQSVFDVIHHFFLTEKGVYLLCFDMSWFVSDLNPQSTSTMQCLQYIESWLNSIVVHTTSTSTGISAPIALVGTHKDWVNSDIDHYRISKLLCDRFHLHPAWKSVIENTISNGNKGQNLIFFPVNNRIGRQDPAVRQLMHRIEEVISSQEYVHQQIPVHWFRCMDEFSNTNKSHLSFQEAVAIGANYGLVDQELVKYLRFLHHMGILMWHDEENLKQTIILNPVEYFVTPATHIICKYNPAAEDRGPDCVHSFPVHRRCAKENPYEWKEFIDRGLLSSHLLNILLKEFTPHPQDIILLMKKFGLIIPFTSGNLGIDSELDLRDSTFEANQYLVPALLPKFSSREDLSWTDLIVSTCSFFFFTQPQLLESEFVTEDDMTSLGFLPFGLFERLIGKAVLWAQLIGSGAKELFLYKDFALMSFGGQRFRLRSDFRLHAIHLDVAGDPLPIIERIQNHVTQLIAECLQSLQYLVVIEFKSYERLAKGSSSKEKETSFVNYEKLKRAMRTHTGLNMSSGKYLTTELLGTAFFLWIKKYIIPKSEFDIFLSYRWADKETTHAIYDRLSLYTVTNRFRSVDVFLDSEVLRDGQVLKEEFGKAICNSSMIVPLVSFAAIEKMFAHDPRTEDNVLIEWILADLLHSSRRSKIERIFPLLIASSSDSDKYLYEKCRELPDIYPEASIRRVSMILTSIGFNSLIPQLHGKTLRTIVNDDLLEKYIWFDMGKCQQQSQPRCVIAETCQRIIDILRDLTEIGGSRNTQNNNSKSPLKNETPPNSTFITAMQETNAEEMDDLPAEEALFLEEEEQEVISFQEVSLYSRRNSAITIKDTTFTTAHGTNDGRSDNTSLEKFSLQDFHLAFAILQNPRKISDMDALQKLLDDLGVTEAEELGECSNDDIFAIEKCLKPVARVKFMQSLLPSRRKNCELAYGILQDSEASGDRDTLSKLLNDLGILKAKDLEDCEDEDLTHLAECLKKVPRTRFVAAIARSQI